MAASDQVDLACNYDHGLRCQGGDVRKSHPAYDVGALADWSLTSLQMKLIKIGARVVRHARAITFQLAEVAVTVPMVRAILAAIRRLRATPSCA